MLRLLDRLEEVLIATLIAVATVLIFLAVTHRFAIGFAADLVGFARAREMPGLADFARSVFMSVNALKMTWAQEACIYLFVWMAKFGAAYGVRTGIHVGVDVVINRLRPELRAKFVLFGLSAGALFTGIAGSLGARFVYHIAQTEQVSADLEMPMWIVYLAVPLGSYLMCFRFLQVAWNFIRTGELPHHDHAQVDGIDPVEAAKEGGPA